MRSRVDHLRALQAGAIVTRTQVLQLQAVHDHYLSCTSQLVHERSDLKSQLSTNLHVAALGMQRSLGRSRIVANGLVQKMQRNLHNLTDAFVAMTREWMVNVLRPFQVTTDKLCSAAPCL